MRLHSRQVAPGPAGTTRRAGTFAMAGLLAVAGAALLVACRRGRQEPGPSTASPAPRHSGSARCRDCHETFYRLWSTSWHGLAMQPFAALAADQLTEQPAPLTIEGHGYQAEPGAGRVREETATGAVRRPITHVLGGKNVYYFLTPHERGRLQVLPLGYDVRRRQWYDVAGSGLRHFRDVAEHAVHWTDPEFTFNASCHGCHVSQLSSSYDVATDSYRTTWAEPGINCETCHGPGDEHIRAAQAAGPGKVPADLKLVAPKAFTHAQKNDMCAPCHARMAPLTAGFRPGEPYFDAFDLVGIENRDFYPDGRDLGETYTLTGWRMSRCAQSGELDCLHCHTSSGRLRWQDRAGATQACLPCHQAKVSEMPAHSHHPQGKAGVPTCIDCHLPKTEFARMVRSDHSMRPPMPAATRAFRSPNACNLCHQDKDALWSDRFVRRWQPRDYQAPVLRRGSLLAAARAGEWSELAAMVGAVKEPRRDEVLAVALLRLLRSCPSVDKQPAILAAMQDRSPWVRAAATEGAEGLTSSEVVAALLQTARDPVRLPRIRAAATLAALPRAMVPVGKRADIEAAMGELEASLAARPDDFGSQVELGRLHASRGNAVRAIAAYETAIRLRADLAAPLVNVSLLYNSVGRNRDAEAALRRALVLEPGSSAAHLDLGMLLGELGRFAEAEAELRAAVQGDPSSAVAAYNLAVVLARDRLDEALPWSRRASELDKASPKYAYTWAFYLARRGERHQAIAVLRRAIDGQAVGADSYALLGRLLAETGREAEARAVRHRAAADTRLPVAERARFGDRGAPAP